MRRVVLIALIPALWGCRGLLTPSTAADRPASQPGLPPQQPRPKETILAASALPPAPPVSRFAIGINEGVSVPARLAQRMSIPEQTLELVEDARINASLGARLVRGHTGNYPAISQMDYEAGPLALQKADAWVLAVQGAGLEPLFMVSPWPGNRTAASTQRYLPRDMLAYTTYVTRIVERYDGDGIDDLPGLLHPVRYWEVDNEVDLKNSTIAKEATVAYDPKLFCTPAEYAQVFLASAAAIKAAYPDALVLNAGLYRPHSEQGSSYFREFTAVPGVLDAIDIVSVHTYHDDLDGERLAIGVRNERYFAPTKPVWVTETSVGTNETINEEDQARMVVTLAVRTALEGADKLLWHTLSEPPAKVSSIAAMYGHSLFRTTADDQLVIKPVGEVFRNLAAFLALHDLNGCVPDGAGAVKLADGTVLLYEGSRAVPGQGASLRTGAALSAGATATAPAWLQ